MKRDAILGTLVVAAGWVGALHCGDDGATPTEDCTNDIDDDGDGQADCNDSDCAAHPRCVSVTSEVDCDDRRDDDGDGRTDCEDSECAGTPACVPRETSCRNGVDDDGDGRTDCEDSECDGRPPCGTTGETECANTVDDDGDGATDCDDTDCAADAHCIPESACSDTVDNDLDGATDCDDTDCASAPACLPETDCGNGADDDGDGATDCDDGDCATSPACFVTGGESCASGPYVLPDDPNGTWRGTIDSRASDHRGTCGGNGARDVVFQFTTTARATIDVSLEGSDFDTVLYLRSGACTGREALEEACNDDAAAGVIWSRIRTTEDAGTYWLFVDAASTTTTTGTYVLTIRVTP